MTLKEQPSTHESLAGLAAIITTHSEKQPLITLPSKVLDYICGRTTGNKSQKLRYIRNTCGVNITLSKESGTNAETNLSLYVPQKTNQSKKLQVKDFLENLCNLALKKNAPLTQVEVRKCWADAKSLDNTLDTKSSPQPEKSPFASPTPDTNWLFLTHNNISENAWARLAGQNSPLFAFIQEQFQGLKLHIINHRIAVDQNDLDMLITRYPDLIGILSASFRVFAETAEKTSLNHNNMLQTIANAEAATAGALRNVVEFTRSRKKIDILDIEIPQLRDSLFFEDKLTQRTCTEDPDFMPTQHLYFRNKSLTHLIKGEHNHFIKRICVKTGCARILANTLGFSIEGPLERVIAARDAIIFFGTLIGEYGYKKPAHLEQALLCALGELDPTELPIPSKPISEKGEKNIAGFDPAKITVNELVPDSDNQDHYVELLNDDRRQAVMTQGPAGTGKTRLFLQSAMRKIRDHYCGKPNAPFSKLILSIPLVTVGGKDLGAVPGDISKKTAMWFETYYDHLARILSPRSVDGTVDLGAGTKALDQLIAAGIIEIAPLEFLRGKSFDHALVALDEAQNASAEQIRTFLTRAETTSRLFVSGDLGQHDRQIPREGEAFRVPSTVTIDDKGMVYVSVLEHEVQLGFHMDIGRFTMGADGKTLAIVSPHNGLAKAFLLYSASPRVSCAVLDKTDIRRSGITFDILALEEEFRVSSNEQTQRSPKGVGVGDPHHALAFAYRDAATRNAGRERVSPTLGEVKPA